VTLAGALFLAPALATAGGGARVCVEDAGSGGARMESERWLRPAEAVAEDGRACFADVPAGAATVSAGGGPALALEVLPGEEIVLRARGGGLEVASRGRRAPGTGLDGRRLRELPGSGEPWSLLETVEPAVIADRIDGGGLYPGQPGRFSTHGSSWRQSSFRSGALDATDPLRAGQPLLWPALDALDAFDVATAALPVDAGPPGAHVLLQRAPAPPRWTLGAQAGTTLGESEAPTAVESTPTRGPEPPVARLSRGRRAALDVGGPLGGSARVALSGIFDEARRFERGAPEAVSSSARGLDARATWAPAEGQELRFHGGVHALRRPSAGAPLFAEHGLRERDDVGGLDAEWRSRRVSGATAWAATGYARGAQDADTGSTPGTFERLLDGPASELPLPGRTTRWRVDAAAGFSLAPRRAGGAWHALGAGVQAARTGARITGSPSVIAGELLGGRPAHAIRFTAAGVSEWRGTDVAVFASDAVTAGRLRVDAGLRLETSGASAAGAEGSIRWTALAPRVAARWEVAGPLSVFASWGRYRHRLPLGLAAWGDPAARTAEVFLWDDANGDRLFQAQERGPLVARGGPGAPIGARDPSLRAPRTDEVVAGLEARTRLLRVSLMGVHRDQRALVESVNVGVPDSAYTVAAVFDPGGDLAGPEDDQLLPLYARPPSTFGADRLLLTNPAGHDARHQGVELTLELLTPRLQVLLGATAHRSEGAGANRGFRPSENDQGLVGELFDDPNAGTQARGRLFSDRAYTIKLSGSYRAPLGVRLGAVARYQDGQPFARLVLAALPQGLTAVQAIPRGRARFTFIATLDARVEKEFLWAGGRRAAVVVEAFNLTGRANEVEEVVVSGNSYRQVTLREPPRTVRVGLRLLGVWGRSTRSVR
jgi:hypothetical protein